MNITLNAKLDRIEALMERIARALEVTVGIASVADAKEPVYDANNPAVTYSDNAQLLREEWRTRAGLPEEEEPLL